MDLIPESYVDRMPCDPDLLAELGRVVWAAARLHSGVRDLINHLDGVTSNDPFSKTLGKAIAVLERKARAEGRVDIVEWVTEMGRPANRERNNVIHAVSHTAADGRQALMTADHSPPGRYLVADLREVSRVLIQASTTLPGASV